MRNVKGQNLGRGISIFIEHVQSEHDMHDDVDAWNAPGECHGLVSQGEDRRFREVRRHIEGVTGLKYREFKEEVKRRTTGSLRWMYFRYGFTI